MPRSVQDQALQVMLPLDRPAYQRPSCRFHRAKIMGYAPLLWPFSESVCLASNLYMYGGDHEFLLHHARRPMPCARIYAQWPLQSTAQAMFYPRRVVLQGTKLHLLLYSYAAERPNIPRSVLSPFLNHNGQRLKSAQHWRDLF